MITQWWKEVEPNFGWFSERSNDYLSLIYHNFSAIFKASRHKMRFKKLGLWKTNFQKWPHWSRDCDVITISKNIFEQIFEKPKRLSTRPVVAISCIYYSFTTITCSICVIFSVKCRVYVVYVYVVYVYVSLFLTAYLHIYCSLASYSMYAYSHNFWSFWDRALNFFLVLG